MRVAGGWVRDKLMGKESEDIDIALDDISGEELTRRLQAFLTSKGIKTGMGVIKMNPDKSKHLETATINIGGTWIDINNLRSETYSEHSRIPEARFGSPLEDALRRDFTINSMFYNLVTQQVEDCTGHGLADLEQGVIRTPLEPRQTFLDDPLRVLRAIRFAARLGFQIHPDILQAMRMQEIRQALAQKVSKERIQKEFAGIIKCGGLYSSLRIIHDNLLWQQVF
jgi:tRNA nucleotidyltransferase (CCA-adding enzyme)